MNILSIFYQFTFKRLLHLSSQLIFFSRSPVHTSPNSQDRAGPSDFQTFSDSLKSRLGALSTRYKEFYC